MTAVTVNLQRVPEGESEYRTVATLEVAADNTYRLTDPDEFFPLEDHVLVLGDPGTEPRRVSFTDDPSTWAQNLPGLLRTGYLVPVVTLAGSDQA